MNTLEIFIVDSDHTDEYLIVYFPRQKTPAHGSMAPLREGATLSPIIGSYRSPVLGGMGEI